MFTMRDVPSHYPDCFLGRRPSTCRQTFTSRPRHTYPRDSRLLQDLTGVMLLPLFESMMGFPTDTTRGQHQRPKVKNWVHKLDLSGYEPDDVTITTQEGRVAIKARRTEGEGDCSDVYESNRSVTIPEGVDIETMKSHFTSDGLLTIEAKFKTEDKNKAPEEIPADIVEDTPKSLPVHEEMTDGDLDLQEADLKNDSDKSLAEKDYIVTDPNEEMEILHEDSETQDIVSDETQKSFKLSFNKNQLVGDDVKVLVKGNSLLVKSQSETCEDGVTRSVYGVTQHTLPDDIDITKLSCLKRSDGELLVTAPYIRS